MKDVQAPAFYKPTDEQFFSREDPSKPDIAFLKNHFYREGRLTDDQGELIARLRGQVSSEAGNTSRYSSGQYARIKSCFHCIWQSVAGLALS